jgi:hypothetical protein
VSSSPTLLTGGSDFVLPLFWLGFVSAFAGFAPDPGGYKPTCGVPSFAGFAPDPGRFTAATSSSITIGSIGRLR